jgi:hypothetical protein
MQFLAVKTFFPMFDGIPNLMKTFVSFPDSDPVIHCESGIGSTTLSVGTHVHDLLAKQYCFYL